jgi:hypothetical protein
LTGLRYGALVVLRPTRDAKGKPVWECLCDCGSSHNVSTGDLNARYVVSCGCRKSRLKHGNSRKSGKTAEYTSWISAKKRCFNQAHSHYSNYGGRGITMSLLWANDYEAFLAYLGPKPTPKHTLDRIENDGHYEPGNVRWATRREQRLNQRPRGWRHMPKTEPSFAPFFVSDSSKNCAG